MRVETGLLPDGLPLSGLSCFHMGECTACDPAAFRVRGDAVQLPANARPGSQSLAQGGAFLLPHGVPYARGRGRHPSERREGFCVSPMPVGIPGGLSQQAVGAWHIPLREGTQGAGMLCRSRHSVPQTSQMTKKSPAGTTRASLQGLPSRHVRQRCVPRRQIVAV